jgi:hypothetical protein
MKSRVLWLTFWVTMSMWFGQGCGSMNIQNQPRQASRLPALDPDTPPTVFSGERSVKGIDRSDWPGDEVRLSRNDVEVRPNYVRSFVIGKRNRVREGGAYPTTETALDLADNPRTKGAQYLEIVVDPIAQLGNLVLAPFRMAFVTRPREIGHGPAANYELQPVTEPVDISPASASP